MTAEPLWLATLETILAPGQVDLAPECLMAYSVDGRLPQAVVFPETAAQVARVLHWAQEQRLAVLPHGSGTMLGLGQPPRGSDLVLSTSRLHHIREYDAANFTMTAEAGVTFFQVARLAAEHWQTLPLQYAFSPATLGGLIATNASPPKRLAYGGVRDLLLGIRVALPSGETAHFGGKVVKNVAGYDMCKLFLGSLGALGVIVEATFKLYALPERDETLLAIFPSLPQGMEAAMQLVATQLLPSQILLLNPAATQAIVSQDAMDMTADGVLLLVNFEGMDEAVEHQLTELSRLCRERGADSLQVLRGEPQLELRQRLHAVLHPSAATASRHSQGPTPEAEPADASVIVARLGTLASQVQAGMQAVTQLFQTVAPDVLVVGDCGLGMVQWRIGYHDPASGAARESLVHALREIPRLVTTDGGYVVIEAAPPEIKGQLDVWGTPPAALPLLKALKAKFDPAGILNPGRYIGGL
jgi:glycolate dehydrogenase FAD-binding subunit